MSRPDQQRIRAAVDRLPEGDVRKLKGFRDEWRLRVGDWRVRFKIDRQQRTLIILAIKPRGDAYKG
jgi:mRNA interferase RelE/StbE